MKTLLKYARFSLPLAVFLLSCGLLFSQTMSIIGGISNNILVVTDNFTRANSGTLGANWTGSCCGFNQLQIVSNQANTITTAFGLDMYSATTFSPNQFAQVTLVNLASSDQAVQVRSALATNDSYACGRRALIDASNYVLYKEVANVLTQIGTTSSIGVNGGDVVRLSANGTHIFCTINGVTPAALSVTDTSQTAGYPGLRAHDVSGTTPVFSNFSAGNL